MADAPAKIVGDEIAKQSKVQSDACETFKLPRTLIGGTTAMRRAAEDYLPKEEGETNEGYVKRVRRSTLFNAFRKTVSDMTGKVFQRPVVLEDDVPADIVQYAENIDLAGRHINVFAKDVFYDGLQTGINYILVDMPPAVQKADGSAPTVADEQGRRPYFVHITAE